MWWGVLGCALIWNRGSLKIWFKQQKLLIFSLYKVWLLYRRTNFVCAVFQTPNGICLDLSAWTHVVTCSLFKKLLQQVLDDSGIVESGLIKSETNWLTIKVKSNTRRVLKLLAFLSLNDIPHLDCGPTWNYESLIRSSPQARHTQILKNVTNLRGKSRIKFLISKPK